MKLPATHCLGYCIFKLICGFPEWCPTTLILMSTCYPKREGRHVSEVISQMPGQAGFTPVFKPNHQEGCTWSSLWSPCGGPGTASCHTGGPGCRRSGCDRGRIPRRCRPCACRVSTVTTRWSARPWLYTHSPHLALSIRCGQKGEEKPAWSSGFWVIQGILHKWVKISVIPLWLSEHNMCMRSGSPITQSTNLPLLWEMLPAGNGTDLQTRENLRSTGIKSRYISQCSFRILCETFSL